MSKEKRGRFNRRERKRQTFGMHCIKEEREKMMARERRIFGRKEKERCTPGMHCNREERESNGVATLLWPSVGVKPNTWKK
jgi:hypothetical protein